MKKTILKRILKGMGANAFGQVVTTLIQLVQIPLFLKYWEIALFGEWQILNAIPSYLSMSDIGFGSVAANEMTMKVSQNDKRAAIEIFQSVWLLITFISFCIISSLMAIIWLIPLRSWFNFSLLSSREINFIIILLAFYVLIGLQQNLLHAGFRCDGNYALGIFCANIIRLSVFIGLVTAIYLGSKPLTAAVVVTALQTIGAFSMRYILSKKSSWIIYGYKFAKIATIKSMFRPSVAFMGFPIGNALSIQGMLLIIGAVLGPVSVVVFSTLRTLTRFGFQVMNMINSTIWPEMSTSYGSGDMQLTRKLHRYSCQISFWASLSAIVFLAFTGEWIIKIWTQGRVSFNPMLFNLLLLIIFTNSLWLTSSIVLIATNKHQKIAFLYVSGSIISLFIAYMLIPLMGVPGAAIALLAIDLLMIFTVIKNSLTLVEDRFFVFVSEILKSPLKLLDIRGYF